MTQEDRKSILQMAQGAIMERVDYEMSRVLDNILDPNTSATAKRKLTVTLTFTPDDEREHITVGTVVKPGLAATNPVVTSLYVADEQNVVEMVAQLPGQMDIEGAEQQRPPLLKVIN